MRYFVLIPDGMADEPISCLGYKSPMESANKPTIDALAKCSLIGTVSNVPEGMVPESDTANLAILSYDPKLFSKGRAPLEAVSMGISMSKNDTAYRCNVVTLSEEEGIPYEDRTIIDHSADEISTEEARELINALNDAFGGEAKTFYTGVSYRHCLIVQDGIERYNFMRPHDILGKRIGDYLPESDGPTKDFYVMMKESFDILNHHPINESRRKRGLRPANSAWFWSPGKKPQLPSFKEKWGLDGVVISAVDLIKGIGLCAGMKSVDVEGATGNVKTNYSGKAEAAINAFKDGADYVYVHVEAPDECGHRAETDNKVLSIELIDSKILAPVLTYLESCGDDFKVLILPDHPTPVRLRTHTIDPVPFMIYDSRIARTGVPSFTENAAKACSYHIENGYTLMELMTKL